MFTLSVKSLYLSSMHTFTLNITTERWIPSNKGWKDDKNKKTWKIVLWCVGLLFGMFLHINIYMHVRMYLCYDPHFKGICHRMNIPFSSCCILCLDYVGIKYVINSYEWKKQYDTFTNIKGKGSNEINGSLRLSKNVLYT